MNRTVIWILLLDFRARGIYSWIERYDAFDASTGAGQGQGLFVIRQGQNCPYTAQHEADSAREPRFLVLE